MASFVSGLSGPGSSPDRGHRAVYLGKADYFESASLHLGERRNPAMD